LRLRVTDPDGLGLKSTVELASEANQVQRTLETDETGSLQLRRLPFGIYRIAVKREGFAPVARSVEIHSEVPLEYRVILGIAPASASIVVKAEQTLVDPYRTGSVGRIGSQRIENRSTSLPGRSIQDLVNAQPGWLYEGNAVLHPRGAEYQTQLVVDGIPLIDNRSPSFGPEIEADGVQSMSVYTAGIPAEYGRKMGGVIEINTSCDDRQGLHGQVVLSGGSFDTAGAFGAAQYGWGKNLVTASAHGDMTGRYLNPPVTQNFTNTATTGDFGLGFERQLTPHDHLNLRLRHEFSRFEVPNEQVQQAAGQRQNGDNDETLGTVSYQHVFSPDVLGDFRGMVRDASAGLASNALSTPIIVFQQNSFREIYFKGTVAVHRGRHEWKAGAESDALFLDENFSDVITDPSQFDPATPQTFSFAGSRPELDQSAFVQDQVRLGAWSISAGLRYDHYQLLVNQNALSPRVGVARYFDRKDLVLHAAYDRVFQTPDFDNILLSSSPEVVSLNPKVLRLPVKPSQGSYFQAGATKGVRGTIRLDTNAYWRRLDNFADDDLLLNTSVSFPIAFRKASIYGAEAKIELPQWRNLSGFVSYSYMVGSAYLPVTGGLFLGDDAQNALKQLNGRFWVTQDQRNTVRTRFRYLITPRLWVALDAEYGSGLPVAFTGTEQEAEAQYGPEVVDRVDFARGRVRPNLSIGVSLGVELWRRDQARLQLQGDAQNLNNRLNLLDFAGLFSGNAIAPPRSFVLRLTASF
jgi:outer membrane cobalamin receptor